MLVGGITSIIGWLAFMALPPSDVVRVAPGASRDLGDPSFGIFALVVVAVAANLCYTLGWIVELPLFWINGDRPAIAPTLLKFGLIFSLFVISVPTLGSLAYWVYRIVR
jgi:hypothetical protein